MPNTEKTKEQIKENPKQSSPLMIEDDYTPVVYDPSTEDHTSEHQSPY